MFGRSLALALALAVSLILVACGGVASTTPGVTFRVPDPSPQPSALITAAPSTATPASTEPLPTPVPGGPTASVDIFDNGFSRAALTVARDTTVTWTNTGRRAHTVTGNNATFGSDGVVNGDGTYSYTFTEAGMFPYVCLIHNDMSGTITVTP